MMVAGEQVRLLTGLTSAMVDDSTVADVLAGYGIDAWGITYTQWGILRAAADLLARTAITTATSSTVTQVEDVSISVPKMGDLLTLARDLRDRADRAEDEAATVAAFVEFHPWGQ